MILDLTLIFGVLYRVSMTSRRSKATTLGFGTLRMGWRKGYVLQRGHPDFWVSARGHPDLDIQVT